MHIAFILFERDYFMIRNLAYRIQWSDITIAPKHLNQR
uniref:Uncharacterized protein n=1 Tax=Rhizophora mucronata TaxID=61149 RepID=A0A2P2NQB3_RHIMU